MACLSCHSCRKAELCQGLTAGCMPALTCGMLDARPTRAGVACTPGVPGCCAVDPEDGADANAAAVTRIAGVVGKLNSSVRDTGAGSLRNVCRVTGLGR